MPKRRTTSFKSAVQDILGESVKASPKAKKKNQKRKKKVNEVYGGGSMSNNSGPGGWNVVQSKGWGGNMPPFSKQSQTMDTTAGNIDMMDIGAVEDKISKNHDNPIFPLEQVPLNILTAGDEIGDQLTLIDQALKNNKSLTTEKKKELEKSKDIIKSILGNIRKVASMVASIQN